MDQSLAIEILDQRDIQKKGGLASRYPTSYIISQILNKYLFQNVLDVTYGVGRFYKISRPSFLVGADIKKREWEIKPDLFFQKAVWSLRYCNDLKRFHFDLIVVDPPWGKNHIRRPEYSDLFGTPELIIQYAIKLAIDLNIQYALVHYDKLIKNKDLEIIENIAFKPLTRYLNIRDYHITYFTLYRIKRQNN